MKNCAHAIIGEKCFQMLTTGVAVVVTVRKKES